MELLNNKNNHSKHKIMRLGIFILFVGLGAILAWRLCDFRSPGGLFIMAGAVLAWVIDQTIYPRTSNLNSLSIFKMRSDGRWPLVRKLSTIAFFIFFCLAPIFQSPKLIENEEIRRSLFLTCAGLGLLGGTPIMFALKSNLRLLGFCSLGMSLMLIVFGLLGAIQVETPPVFKMIGLAFGMVLPLILVLFYLRRT